jgi:trimethylamine--corrinoid protein Co-methyltransferase
MMEEYSKTPDIVSISSHNKIDILSPSEIDNLRKGTYQLLAEVGVSYLSRKALTIFADHGAEVDWDTNIVRIPPDLVKKAMATAPRNIVLGGRDGLRENLMWP